MDNIARLMQANRVGMFPKIEPSFIGIFAAIGSGGLGGIVAHFAGLQPVQAAMLVLSCIVLMWIANRYLERSGDGNNGGWHWLTEPPVNAAFEAKRPGKLCSQTTAIIQKKTGSDSLVAEETRSDQYRVLVVRNDDPALLSEKEKGIRSAIAITNGIKNPESVKFVPVHDRGQSAFLVPLDKAGWSDVAFDESLIERGKPVVQLGRDLSGNPVSVDLKTNPHTIVAGATGSGKTAWIMVYIKSLLMSGLEPIVYILDPNDNLSMFSDDCLDSGGAYITNLDEGAELLHRLVEDMPALPKDATERELKACEQAADDMHLHNFVARKARFKGAQNIWSFRKNGGTGEDARPVVFVTDEAAAYTVHPDKELKKQFVADVSAVGRRFRASGALMLVATQRPSADILPGELKSNCGNIIAFSHANKTSSRVTLDSDAAAGIPNLGGFAAKFGGSEEIIYGRAAYLDL